MNPRGVRCVRGRPTALTLPVAAPSPPKSRTQRCTCRLDTARAMDGAISARMVLPPMPRSRAAAQPGLPPRWAACCLWGHHQAAPEGQGQSTRPSRLLPGPAPPAPPAPLARWRPPAPGWLALQSHSLPACTWACLQAAAAAAAPAPTCARSFPPFMPPLIQEIRDEACLAMAAQARRALLLPLHSITPKARSSPPLAPAHTPRMAPHAPADAARARVRAQPVGPRRQPAAHSGGGPHGRRAGRVRAGRRARARAAALLRLLAAGVPAAVPAAARARGHAGRGGGLGACVCVCARACMRACMCGTHCVRACMCVCAHARAAPCACVRAHVALCGNPCMRSAAPS